MNNLLYRLFRCRHHKETLNSWEYGAMSTVQHPARYRCERFLHLTGEHR